MLKSVGGYRVVKSAVDGARRVTLSLLPSRRSDAPTVRVIYSARDLEPLVDAVNPSFKPKGTAYAVLEDGWYLEYDGR